MDSPPAETIEEKMPEENAEETDMLASEEPPAKQGTDWSVYVPLYVETLGAPRILAAGVDHSSPSTPGVFFPLLVVTFRIANTFA